MEDSLLYAIMVAVLGVIGNAINNAINSNKNNELQDARMEKYNELNKQAMQAMENEIKDLARKVEAHNNYGLEIRELKTRISIIEKGANNGK